MGSAAPEVADIMRLERQVAARDEVIRQLNRQLHERVPAAPDTEQDVSPEVMEEYVFKLRALEDEIIRLRQVLETVPPVPVVPGDFEAPAHRSTARRIASGLKRRLLR
jgi:hypothetical protein